MKISEKVLVLLMMVLMIAASGCAHRRANLETTENGVAYSDTNLSIFQRSLDPGEMADAKLTLALAKQLEKGQPTATEASGKYIGVIINNDMYRTAYVAHPENQLKIKVAPGSAKFIFTNRVPDKFIIYNLAGNPKQVPAFKKSGVYNGVSYDYGMRVLEVL